MSSFGKNGVITASSLVEAGSDNFGIMMKGSVGVSDFGASELGFKEIDFTPSTGNNSSTPISCTFDMSIFGNGKYHLVCDIEWSGFSTITDTNFDLFFQGAQYKISTGTWVWETGVNRLGAALNSQARPRDLVKGSATGTYHYDTIANVTNATTYGAFRLQFRSNYSNGTGNIKLTNLQICPEKFYVMNKASIFKSGEVGGNNFYEF